MKKRYLKTAESVLALKDTDTKIYEERSKWYYKFVKGVLCRFNAYNGVTYFNCKLDMEEDIYILEEEPMQEATEDDIDKLCKFWDNDENNFRISILRSIKIESKTDYPFSDDFDDEWLHCRRLTPSEISELTGYFVEERKKDE